MTERAEQLVLAYLATASDAAQRYLPPGRRTAYVAELRTRIESARGTARATDPERVQRVLRSFGDPVELVERECAAPGETAEALASGASEPENTTHATRNGNRTGASSPIGGMARPVRLERAPPPWRGGPRRSTMRRRADSGAAPASARAERSAGFRANSPAMLMLWLGTAARRHPLEVFSVVLYLFGCVVEPIAFVWIIGAAQAVLSGVWEGRDKLVAVGAPVAATAVGMALWPGEAPFIDEIILGALMDTGITGLRVGLAGCVLYLAARIAVITRAEGA